VYVRRFPRLHPPSRAGGRRNGDRGGELSQERRQRRRSKERRQERRACKLIQGGPTRPPLTLRGPRAGALGGTKLQRGRNLQRHDPKFPCPPTGPRHLSRAPQLTPQPVRAPEQRSPPPLPPWTPLTSRVEEGPLGPLGFECSHHRQTRRPTVDGTRSKAGLIASF